jgi:hypothetical protein
MDGIEAFRLFPRKLDASLSNDPQASFLKTSIDLAR